MAGWIKLNNKELHDLCSSPNVIRMIKSRRMKWAGDLAQRGRKETCIGYWWEKRPLGRPKQRWLNNIKMDLRETGWGGIDWISLAQGRNKWRGLVNVIMSLQVP
jgi:hypothetical protein